MYTVTFSAGAIFGLGIFAGLTLAVVVLVIAAITANEKKNKKEK